MFRRSTSLVRLYARPPSSVSSYSSSSSSLPPPPGRSRSLSLLAGASLAVISYTVGSLYPPPTLKLLFPRPAPPPPSANSLEGQSLTDSIESQLQSLPSLLSHRRLPEADEWYETRPYANVAPERKVNHLTTGSLHGPGKLAILPLVRAKYDESEALVYVHLGRALCGHDGIIHGGLLATILDECMGRAAIMNLPEKIGVTAKLDIKYRAPTKADNFVIIHTKLAPPSSTPSSSNRRISLTATVHEASTGTLLVEADALFVQPRYAKLLNSHGIREALGEPPVRKARDPVLLGEGTELANKGRF